MEQDQLLEEGERMIEKVRKHWFVYVDDFLLHVFGCLVFIVAVHYVTSRSMVPYIKTSNGSYIAPILMMFVIIFWVSFFYAWTKNYFDVWYITDRHIIAVDQKEMFEREESFMELTRTQDVSFEKNTFIQTLFGFGRLKVQTAGKDQEFVIDNVHDVEAVSHRIMELRDKAQGVTKDFAIGA